VPPTAAKSLELDGAADQAKSLELDGAPNRRGTQDACDGSRAPLEHIEFGLADA
jgi:hypothetical protein